MLRQELVETFKHGNEYEVFACDKTEIDITKEKEAINKISKLKPAIILNASAYTTIDKAE